MGVSAISHIGATDSQNARDLPQWQASISDGRLPVSRGLRMSDEDLLRADVIQELMCQGIVSIRNSRVVTTSISVRISAVRSSRSSR